GGEEGAGGKEGGRGLEADEVVEGGGDASRAGGVGAEREADHAGRDGDGGSGTRAAGDVARVEDARTGAVGRARADESGGELVHVGLADGEGAGFGERLDDGRAAGGRVRVGGTAGGGREAGEVDVVF